jgi:hypothetical protein
VFTGQAANRRGSILLEGGFLNKMLVRRPNLFGALLLLMHPEGIGASRLGGCRTHQAHRKDRHFGKNDKGKEGKEGMINRVQKTLLPSDNVSIFSATKVKPEPHTRDSTHTVHFPTIRPS